jgi:RNA polymerase sigma factor (sigma-70 family)
VAAVPSRGRAAGAVAPEAKLTQALYERHATRIFRYCLHQLGSREEAEDAVQSTFLNAFRGVKRGVVPENESAWLFKIAENVCLSRRRSTWRRDRVESPADFGVVEELTPAPSRLADELLGLQDVLEQLPESQRRAILLREWQGLSYREIAEELELSQTAVETLIFRARRSLAKGLEQPPEPAQKRRVVRGADLGNLLAGLKSLVLGGGAVAAKVAAVVAVVGAGTVVASSHTPHRGRTHAPVTPVPAPASTVAPTVPDSGIDVHRPAPVRHPAVRATAPPTAAVSVPARTIADPVVPTDTPPAGPSADQSAPPAVVPPTPPGQVPAPSTPTAADTSGTRSDSGKGQGNGQDQGNGNGKPGDSSPGNSGQSGGGPGQGSGATPSPPAGGSSSGSGGNGNGNGQGGGGGHGPGH